MGGVAVVLRVHHRTPLDPVSLAVFVLALLVAAIVTWRRPAAGLGLLLALEPFDLARDIGSSQITLGKVALLGVLGSLVLRRPSLAALRSPDVRPIVLGALAIVTLTALTVIPATYLAPVLRETVKALEYLAIFVAFAIAVRDDADELLVVRAIALTALVVSSLALSELAGGAPSGLWIAGRVLPRIAGPLDGPNQLAGYLDLVVPLLIAATFVIRDRVSRTVLFFAVVADVFTLSRAGLFGILAGVTILLVAWRGEVSRRAQLVAGAVAVLVAAAAWKLGVAVRFFSVGEESETTGLGNRAELWASAVTLWKRDPGLGSGAGNFELLLPTTGLMDVRTHANSLYLQSLAEGGLALFFAVTWTLGAAIVASLRHARRSWYLLGFGGAACAFAIHQLFDLLVFFPKVGTLWWALLGLAVARIARTSTASESERDA